jgi:hypothetical protein
MAMTSSIASLQRRLQRLTPEQRAQVNALLETLEQSAGSEASSPRQPGGLLGKMYTHGDFNAPLGEEFLLP